MNKVTKYVKIKNWMDRKEINRQEAKELVIPGSITRDIYHSIANNLPVLVTTILNDQGEGLEILEYTLKGA